MSGAQARLEAVRAYACCAGTVIDIEAILAPSQPDVHVGHGMLPCERNVARRMTL